MGMGGGCNESGGKSGNVRESIGVDDGVRSDGSPDWVAGTTFALGLACLPLAREKVENHEAGRSGGVDVELERSEDVTGGGRGAGDSETGAEAWAVSEGGVTGGVYELSWLMGGSEGNGRTSSATALDNGVLVAVEGVASVEISSSCEKEYLSTHTLCQSKNPRSSERQRTPKHVRVHIHVHILPIHIRNRYPLHHLHLSSLRCRKLRQRTSQRTPLFRFGKHNGHTRSRRRCLLAQCGWKPVCY